MSVSAVEGFSSADAGRPAAAIVGAPSLTAFGLPPALAWLGMSISREVDALERERDELKKLYGRARHDALVDGLTGLGNHRAFQDELARQLEVSKRMDMPLALLLIDVDDLKVVNDERATPAATELVAVGRRSMASSCSARRTGRSGSAATSSRSSCRAPTSRPGSSVGRGSSRRRAQRRRPDHADRAVLAVDRGVRLPASEHRQPRLYRNADAALYWCKRHGRTDRRRLRPGAATASASTTARSPSCRRPSALVLAAGAAPGLPADLLADDRRGDRLRGPRPADRRRSVRRRQRAVRRGRARRPDGRARHGLPRDRRRRRRRPDSDAYLSVNLSPRTLESEPVPPAS